MKKLLFVLAFAFISSQAISQRVTPKLNQHYLTSSLGYSGCKDEYTLKRLMQAVKAKDNVTFKRYHDNGDCLVFKREVIVKVINITNDGHWVELKKEGINASLWTVTEALKEY